MVLRKPWRIKLLGRRLACSWFRKFGLGQDVADEQLGHLDTMVQSDFRRYQMTSFLHILKGRRGMMGKMCSIDSTTHLYGHYGLHTVRGCFLATCCHRLIEYHPRKEDVLLAVNSFSDSLLCCSFSMCFSQLGSTSRS